MEKNYKLQFMGFDFKREIQYHMNQLKLLMHKHNFIIIFVMNNFAYVAYVWYKDEKKKTHFFSEGSLLCRVTDTCSQ